MFKVQEQITSHCSVFIEVIKDSFLFVCLREKKLFLVGMCQKMPTFSEN